MYVCNNVEWKSSVFPNLLNQSLPESEYLASQFWHQLHTISCDLEFQFLVCSILSPPCIPGVTEPIPPCRELCQLSLAQCLPLMRKYGLSWPDESFFCEDLPYTHEQPCLYFREGQVIYPPGVMTDCANKNFREGLPESSDSTSEYDDFYIDYDTATVTKTASTISTLKNNYEEPLELPKASSLVSVQSHKKQKKIKNTITSDGSLYLETSIEKPKEKNSDIYFEKLDLDSDDEDLESKYSGSG